MPTLFTHWLLEPYGAPTCTSEVSCIPDFYCVEALIVCGPPAATLAGAVSNAVSRAAEGAADIIADIATATAVRPAT